MLNQLELSKLPNKHPFGSTAGAGVCLGLQNGDAQSGSSHKHLPCHSFPWRSGCMAGGIVLDDPGCHYLAELEVLQSVPAFPWWFGQTPL